MTAAWWGRLFNGPETARNAPESAEQPDRDQLRAPTGVEVWVSDDPLNGKAYHDRQWQAENRAASRGGLAYPVVVEEESA